MLIVNVMTNCLSLLPVLLDGLKSQAELLGYVYDDITTEIENLRVSIGKVFVCIPHGILVTFFSFIFKAIYLCVLFTAKD